MFFVVFLSDLHENRVVKASWIKTLPVLSMIKNSINRNIAHLIFLSNEENDTPNFDLPISQKNRDRACFVGYLIKSFGK